MCFNPVKINSSSSSSNSCSYSKENFFGSGMTTLITSNEEMDDIVKMIKSLEKSGLLVKGFSETIKNQAKNQKDGFIGMLLGILGASLLGNLLTSKGVMRAGEGKITAGQEF